MLCTTYGPPPPLHASIPQGPYYAFLIVWRNERGQIVDAGIYSESPVTQMGMWPEQSLVCRHEGRSYERAYLRAKAHVLRWHRGLLHHKTLSAQLARDWQGPRVLTARQVPWRRRP